jgi:spore photoproduct lyase
VSHLDAITLDPARNYHIGTGQSSDSLMWGNRFGLLDSLYRFASNNANVILELKSKSGRIDYFMKNRPPANMVFTWSLNTPVVIQHEEKGTASLDKRLEGARTLADQGYPVGFHFHPMVWYKGWQDDYLSLVSRLADTFRPEEVVMISLGTLTFIKPVLKRIRERMPASSILQMPMEECAGKLSYPFDIKQALFSTVYSAFPDSWKADVFFYMCMEDIGLWEPVFGRSYASNEAFEADMFDIYQAKMLQFPKFNS